MFKFKFIQFKPAQTELIMFDTYIYYVYTSYDEVKCG